MNEPYLVTVIRQIADLEAMENPTADETARLNQYLRWLRKHYPAVHAALASEYTAIRQRNACLLLDLR